MLKSVFEYEILNNTVSSGNVTIGVETILLCTLSALILGIVVAFVHKYTGKYSKNFLITLSVLPILVECVMMMVNGSLGTSIAILGAFGLIRFRSLPGTSKEILSVFFSMSVGLACGMGQIGFAVIVTTIVSIAIIVLSRLQIFEKNKKERILKVNIPESMDYNGMFDDIFDKYLSSYELLKVKTVNMGTIFEVAYKVYLKDNKEDKKFIDDIRIKNCNLKVQLSQDIEENEF